MMFKAILLAVPALCLAAPLAAQTEAAAKPVKPKKICRSEIAVGSIMPRNICHTQAEWAEIDETNSDNARDTLDRPHAPSVQRP
jgi:hypothetical protein